MNLSQILCNKSTSIDDFSDLQTPVYKRQRKDDMDMDGSKSLAVYVPSDSLAYCTSINNPIMFTQ